MGNLLHLRYRYAEQEETPAIVRENILDFSVLPQSQLDALKNAAEELDLAKTREIVTALKATHPAIAASIEEFAQGFRFDRIVALCKV
jgi:hypothetical protein